MYVNNHVTSGGVIRIVVDRTEGNKRSGAEWTGDVGCSALSQTDVFRIPAPRRGHGPKEFAPERDYCGGFPLKNSQRLRALLHGRTSTRRGGVLIGLTGQQSRRCRNVRDQ